MKDISDEEAMSQLADIAIGYQECSNIEIVEAVKQLKVSENILLASQNAIARKRFIEEAVANLLAELATLSEDY